jgi:hypothetical protein
MMTTAPGSSFAPTDALVAAVKQIHAGDLDVGLVDVGPAAGRAVLLLHGWPYDIHSFAEVIPILAEEGGGADTEIRTQDLLLRIRWV